MLALALLACAAPLGDEAVLLTGWSYAWEQLSHRISYLEVGVGEDASLALGLVGGDWSTGATYADTPMYRVRYQRVRGADVPVLRGSAWLVLGPEPGGTATIELDVAGIPEDAELTAILNGFSIDTDVPRPEGYPEDYDPGHGYTSNGFAFALGEVDRDGDRARVDVEATVRWGPQDRDDMNAAIPHAETAVRVDVAVIAAPYAAERLALAAESDPPHDEKVYSEQPPMVLDAAFAGGAPEGIVGWRSFDLLLDPVGADAGQGDYLRAFGVELAPGEDGRGTFRGEVTATLSTSSLLELTDPRVAFAGELVRVGADDVLAEHWLVEGSHPTGVARTPPPAR